MNAKGPWNKGNPCAQGGGSDPFTRYNVRAQNGPGIAELELWPGPDLSASPDLLIEEH